LYTRDINCYGTVRQNHTGMPKGPWQEYIKIVMGVIYVLGWEVIWHEWFGKTSKMVHILPNMHKPPREGNFFVE
jgi:hypothetical protein